MPPQALRTGIGLPSYGHNLWYNPCERRGGAQRQLSTRRVAYRTKGPLVARKRPSVLDAIQPAGPVGVEHGRLGDDATDGFDHSRPSRAQQLIELGALRLSSVRNGAVHTIRLSGELDLATTDRVEDELKRVEASDARTIVVDLSDLAFINSSGVHLLVDAEVRSRASNGLTLLRGSPAVQRVLELCGVDAALPFAD